MDHKGDLLDIVHWLSKHCRFNHKKYPEKFRKPGASLQNEENSNEIGIEKNMRDKKRNKKKLLKVNPKQEKIRIKTVLKENKIRTWGPDIPIIIENFEQLVESYEVSEQLVKNLKEQDYSKPTPVQMQVWPLMFNGREILATSPTGSGKTAGFLVPILHRLERHKKKGFRAVLLAPTRELAKQTYSECLLLSEGTGIEVCLLNDVRNAKHKINADSIKKYDILITTPNSLVYLITQEDPINLSKVRWLIIDESDRLFEDGKMGFRNQIAVIYKACDSGKVCRALFSATVAPDVHEWCKVTLNNVAMVTVGAKNTACKDVRQELVYCGENDDDSYAKSLALNEIFQNGYEVPCIIFVNTKERAQSLFKDLILDRNVVAIHSDIPKRPRDNLIKSFRMGKIFILICTDLISRGLDFQGVNLVINYDFPYNIASYIHRIGRTGRAGHKGKAITFWSKKDAPKLKGVATIMHQSGSEVPDFILNMKNRNKNKRRKPKLGKSNEVGKSKRKSGKQKTDKVVKDKKKSGQLEKYDKTIKKKQKIEQLEKSGKSSKNIKRKMKSDSPGEPIKKRPKITN